MSEFSDLEAIFNPRTVAVVGASTRMRGPGNFVDALLDQGFPAVYPVNPKQAEISGRRCYASLADIPGPVDHVIVAAPASAVPDLLEQAGAKGVRSIHFFTAGFAETGEPEGAAMQAAMLQRARALGIRLIGPNCMGLYVPRRRLTFGAEMPREAGRVAFFSQSGSNAHDIVYNGAARGLRFSKVVSFGNAIDVDAAELFAYAAEDTETEIVGAYLEGVEDARPLFAALRRLAGRKPVALLKGGLTASGGRATHSHTASLAGSGEIWRAAATQANAILVEDMTEIADVLVGWQFGAVPAGPRLAVIVGGGGVAVQAADDVERAGLALPPLSPATQEALRRFTPLAGTSVRNPVDTVSLWDVSTLQRTLETVAADPGIDAMVMQLGMGWGVWRPQEDAQRHNTTMIDALTGARAVLAGKVLVLSVPPPSDPRSATATADLVTRASQAGFAVFDSVGDAARALRRLLTWRERGGVSPRAEADG